MRPNNPRAGNAQPEITSQNVEQAWLAYAALARLASFDRTLHSNPYFSALHDTAYARFLVAYEAL